MIVSLRIYNTMSRRLEEIVPLEAGHVRMYTCGPTVFHYAHIGKAWTPSMTARRLKGKDSVPRLWEYKGRIYADNLFRLYDEVGLPLAVSIAECRKRGWIPCLAQFKSDALQAGWSKHRADTTIKEALEDA